jgi:hypothetical protein
MKVLCSYCRTSLDDKEPLDNDIVFHGICEDCLKYYKQQWKGLSLGEYLDRFESPVLVVDKDCRILAANQGMADMLGKGER